MRNEEEEGPPGTTNCERWTMNDGSWTINEAAGEAGGQFYLCTKARRVHPLDFQDEVEVAVHGDDLFDPVMDHGGRMDGTAGGNVFVAFQ